MLKDQYSTFLTVYQQDTEMVIIVPADDLAPDGARSSAGTMITTNLDVIFFSTFSAVIDL